MSRKARVPQGKGKVQQAGEGWPEDAADLLGREIRRRCGPDSTFEERRAMAQQVMADVLALTLGVEGGGEPEGGGHDDD